MKRIRSRRDSTGRTSTGAAETPAAEASCEGRTVICASTLDDRSARLQPAPERLRWSADEVALDERSRGAQRRPHFPARRVGAESVLDAGAGFADRLQRPLHPHALDAPVPGDLRPDEVPGALAPQLEGELDAAERARGDRQLRARGEAGGVAIDDGGGVDRVVPLRVTRDVVEHRRTRRWRRIDIDGVRSVYVAHR